MREKTRTCPMCDGTGETGERKWNCSRCGGEGELTRSVRPDLRVVILDETQHWNAETVRTTGRVFRLYLVDFNERTYIASFTPNVFGWHIHGISQHPIPEDREGEELWNNVYMGTEYHGGSEYESDYFAPGVMERNVIYRVPQDELEKNLENNAWETEKGYREMMEEIAQAYRENMLSIDFREGGDPYLMGYDAESQRIENA